MTDTEQAVLAESANRFDEFAASVDEIAPAAGRRVRREIPEPDDPEPLGEDGGLDSIAYDFEHDGDRFVVRFSKGPDAAENMDTARLRLRNLARARTFEIPHLEVLTAHSLPDDAIVTTWAEGTPSNQLSPEAIEAVPDEVLTSLEETATKMEAAGLVLDIQWGSEGEETENPFDRVVAHVDAESGPTYFDVINAEENEERVSEAGRHFAELVTTMVATDSSLEPGTSRYRALTIREVTSRIALLDRAYHVALQHWPESTGLGWLERTAGRMIDTLSSYEQGVVMARADRLKLPLGYRPTYE